MAEIGTISLFIAFLVSVYCVAAYILGIRRKNGALIDSANGGVLALGVLTTVASLALVYSLMVSDFSLKYVVEYTSSDLKPVYKLSAFWAGQEGSLLLWLWTLAAFVIVATFFYERDVKAMVPYVSAILMGLAVFFTFVLNFVTPPFVRLPVPRPEGFGLNPLLQNPGMLIHPTTLYIGYVGFSVPFAYAITALITRRVDEWWIKLTRRWTLMAWLFLGIGIIYGGQWAYVELGWGGYWAWDPVENASLLPWLTATAFFHSVMIQERKGMLKMWNVMLIVVTFILTLFGTLLTRSSILSSVHSFGQSTLAWYFLGFIAVVSAASLYIALDRREMLREEHPFESMISRESSFLLNNLLLVGAAFAVFWGTIFPIISDAVRGVKVTVGPPFFNQVNVPIGIALLILMGICPLIAWRKASLQNLRKNFMLPSGMALVLIVILAALGVRRVGALIALWGCAFVFATIGLEVYRGTVVRQQLSGESLLTAFGRLINRNRRRYGGYAVHLAVILMFFGFSGTAFNRETDVSLQVGESASIGDYTVYYNGLTQRLEGVNTYIGADLRLAKAGRDVGILRPEKQFSPYSEQPSTEVAVLGGLVEDFYVILGGWDEGGKVATFKLKVNPFVAWVWLGEYLMIVGTLFSVWPERRRRLALSPAGKWQWQTVRGRSVGQ